MSKVSDKFENVWCYIAFCVLVLVLAWGYLEVTPNQMSAEYDWACAQMGGGAQ